MTPTARRPLVLLLVPAAAAALFASACLREERLDVAPNSCGCRGAFCIGSVVGKTSPSSDEEAAGCSGCHFNELGRCVDGCRSVEVVMDVPGCAVAYACKTWDRVEPGAACATRTDCEPGSVGGEPVNTLDCLEGRCADVGQAKWDSVPLAPRSCGGDPFFGPHPQCDGAACLSPRQFGLDRYCSTARCVGDSDCPEGWFCRCQEETTWDNLLRGWRWCVPADFPDAGAPDAGEADAGEAGEDAGQPDETPDAGQ